MKAVVIGRFQPFHKGHGYIVERAREEFGEVIIGIGSKEKSRTFDNPLTLDERKDIIEGCYPDIDIFSVRDVGDDKGWMEPVEEKLSEILDGDLQDEITLVGMNDWTKRCFEKAGYRVRSYDHLRPEVYSGTNIRKLVLEGSEWKDLVPVCAAEELERIGFGRIVREEISK